MSDDFSKVGRETRLRTILTQCISSRCFLGFIFIFLIVFIIYAFRDKITKSTIQLHLNFGILSLHKSMALLWTFRIFCLLVKMQTFRWLSGEMKSQTFNFSASFSCSASLTSYWYNLNPVKVNRFLSHSKFLVFGRHRKRQGFVLCSLIPGQDSNWSHIWNCSVVFHHHVILLQKFRVSGEGASEAVMVGVIVLRNQAPVSPLQHLFLP